MRMWRLTFVMAVGLMLAGMGSVVAQDDPGDTAPFPYVTGTLTYVEDVAEPAIDVVDGTWIVRDAYATYDLAMSDPRVSGTYSTLGATEDAHPNEVIAWSVPVQLDAQTGDRWTGTISGTFHPEMGWQGTGWLASAEPDDTSVFFLHLESPERADGIWEVEGVIHDGYASSEDASGDTIAATDVARIAAARGGQPAE
jgi:hypothetical protein